jgi:hypothetical protein
VCAAVDARKRVGSRKKAHKHWYQLWRKRMWMMMMMMVMIHGVVEVANYSRVRLTMSLVWKLLAAAAAAAAKVCWASLESNDVMVAHSNWYLMMRMRTTYDWKTLFETNGKISEARMRKKWMRNAKRMLFHQKLVIMVPQTKDQHLKYRLLIAEDVRKNCSMKTSALIRTMCDAAAEVVDVEIEKKRTT